MTLAGEKVRALTDPQQATVATEETTATTTYTDLATAGPAVTVSLRAAQQCLVTVECGFFLDTSPAGARARMSFAVSGAETIAASDTDSAFTSIPADYVIGIKNTLFTATTGGDYTFTSKYKVTGAVTGTWSARRITAVPFP